MKKYLFAFTVLLIFGIGITAMYDDIRFENYDDDDDFDFLSLRERETEKIPAAETSKEVPPPPRVTTPDVPEKPKKMAQPIRKIIIQEKINQYTKGEPLTPILKKYLEIELIQHPAKKTLPDYLEKYAKEKIEAMEKNIKKLKNLIEQSKPAPPQKKVILKKVKSAS